MHIGRIEGCTRILNAPVGWDAKADGPCGALPIRDEQMPEGPCMVSAWFPTPDEMERIAAGAPVYLWILGRSHPPVMLGVGLAPDSDEDTDGDAT